MSAMEHELKTDPQLFDDVAAGRKKFEIRKNDRIGGFNVGDVLALRKTRYTGEEMMMERKPLEYVGPPLHVRVTHVLRGPCYGLAGGWVIMSIETCDGVSRSTSTTKRACDALPQSIQEALNSGDGVYRP